MSEWSEWRYIVWVGGVDDYYTNYIDAKKAHDEWVAQGYKDVIIERIEEIGDITARFNPNGTY